MLPDLSLTIEPKRLARNGETVTGQYAIQDMQRLGKLLHDQSGQASFRLIFSYDREQERSLIQGNISAKLNITCQRCLEGMELDINAGVSLGITDNMAEAARLPESLDPLLVGSEPVLLLGLIEDELILALPISARHVSGDCKARELTNTTAEKTGHKPFAGLNKLIRT